jgi:uncharacterized protein YjiS (DUF1127 family)
MLLNYRGPATAAEALAQAIAAIARLVSLCVKQFYKAFKHRRVIAVLTDRDDRMLADIGLTRSDLREGICQPLWRDPTAVLARRAGPTRVNDTASEVRRWWPGADKNRRALAELNDDQLSNLSDIGRQIRREARRARATGAELGGRALERARSGPRSLRSRHPALFRYTGIRRMLFTVVANGVRLLVILVSALLPFIGSRQAQSGFSSRSLSRFVYTAG